jgi:ribonuclease BN (tRNA processing enzyme)
VAEVAKSAGVGRLLLVHFNPLMEETEPIRLDSIRSIFPATDIGLDRLEVEL